MNNGKLLCGGSQTFASEYVWKVARAVAEQIAVRGDISTTCD